MKEALARFISVVFHPFLMATYLYVLFAFTLPALLSPIRTEAINHVLLLIFMITFILPVAMIMALKIFGNIASFSMPERRERYFPFALILFLYLLMTFFFYKNLGFTFSDNFFRLLVILDALVVVATVFTFFYKVSVHSMAIWGVAGILIPLNQDSADGILFYPILITILLAGVVMWSRLYLQAHSLSEVVIGMLVGFITTFGLMIAIF